MSTMIPSAFFEFIAADIMVAFTQKSPEFSVEDASGGVSGGISGGVSVELDDLLELIRSQPGIRVAKLASQTGKPVRTIERRLKQLKDSQRIEFRGAPKTGGLLPAKFPGGTMTDYKKIVKPK